MGAFLCRFDFFFHPCLMSLLLLLLLVLLLQLAKVFHSTVHIESSISHKYRPQIWENERTHIYVLRMDVSITCTQTHTHTYTSYTNNIHIGKLLFLLWQIKLFSNLLLSFSILVAAIFGVGVFCSFAFSFFFRLCLSNRYAMLSLV